MSPLSDRREVALLDVIAFRDWLREHRHQVVGFSASEQGCPIARFLSETCGVPYIVDWDSYHLLTFACGSLPLPAWAQAFIRRLDFTYASDEVSGEQALKLLFQVTDVLDGIGEQYISYQL